MAILLFRVDDGVHGDEPWVSDGTPGGTRLLRDINPEGSSLGAGGDALNTSFALPDGDVLFSASAAGVGALASAWLADGVSASQVLDRMPLSADHVHRLADGYLLNDDSVGLVRRGADGGTTALLTAPPLDGTVASTAAVNPLDFVELNGQVLFAATVSARTDLRSREVVDPGLGRELFVTDGTVAGTRLLRDLLPTPEGADGAPNPSSSPQLSEAGLINGRLVFPASRLAGIGDRDTVTLWSTDGTAAGTQPLITLNNDRLSSEGPSVLSTFTPIGDRLALLANVGELATGPALILTGGAPGDVTVVDRDGLPATDRPDFAPVSIMRIVEADGALFLVAEAVRRETLNTPELLYRVNPRTGAVTPAATPRIDRFEEYGDVNVVAVTGGEYLVRTAGFAFDLDPPPPGVFAVNMTTGESRSILSLEAGADALIRRNSVILDPLQPVFELGDALVLNVVRTMDGVTQRALYGWREGDAAAVELITFVDSADGPGEAPDYLVAGDALFFAIDDPPLNASIDEARRELWATDGTAAGTRQMLDLTGVRPVTAGDLEITLIAAVQDDGGETRSTDLPAPLQYLASHPDLAAVFGADPGAAAAHFSAHGAAEGRAVTFDGLAYLASHPDLIAAFGADAEAGAGHFLRHGRDEGRAITFDATAYLASHPDLIAAFGADLAAGARHFVAHGFAEDRAIDFDGLAYVASHADLVAALGADAAAGAAHYVANGWAEGRAVTFDAFLYLASHADLQDAFGVDPAAAAAHYIRHGFGEGRALDFDPLDYVASHADLIGTLGADAGAGLAHWLDFGRAEGRASDAFDEAQYLVNNPDVAAAGLDPALHFILHGFAEGRADDVL